jgi:hypothetical protein
MSDEPLINTIKGNLPVASLAYRHHWEDTDTYTKFVEQYFLGDELVKESAHVMLKKVPSMQAKQGEF